MLFVFEIIASELLALKCLCYADNACHRESMPEQAVLRFCISLKETFSNAITFTVTNKHEKQAIFLMKTVFQPILLCCLSKGPPKLYFLDIYAMMFFGPLNFGNTSAMSSSFFETCLKFNVNFKNANKKIQKKFFVFEIIPSELVALNCLY